MCVWDEVRGVVVSEGVYAFSFHMCVLLFAYQTQVCADLKCLTCWVYPQADRLCAVLCCSALWGHLQHTQIIWFWTRRSTAWEYDPITYTLRGHDEIGEFLSLVQWGHWNLTRISLHWMTQWRENKVTEGIIFSMIPFISCEFHSIWSLLIKTPRPVGSRGRNCLFEVKLVRPYLWPTDFDVNG